jgi:Transglutaminase-like superfamily
MMVLARQEEAFRPLPIRGKFALAYEILRTYFHVRRLARDRDIRAVIEALRTDVPVVGRDNATFVNGLRLGRAVGRTLRLLPSDTRCLIRSLVLTAMLSRRGIESSLVIGVRSDEGFEAHAWVEHRGTPLLPDEDFGRLVELPALGGRERTA